MCFAFYFLQNKKKIFSSISCFFFHYLYRRFMFLLSFRWLLLASNRTCFCLPTTWCVFVCVCARDFIVSDQSSNSIWFLDSNNGISKQRNILHNTTFATFKTRLSKWYWRGMAGEARRSLFRLADGFLIFFVLFFSFSCLIIARLKLKKEKNKREARNEGCNENF